MLVNVFGMLHTQTKSQNLIYLMPADLPTYMCTKGIKKLPSIYCMF